MTRENHELFYWGDVEYLKDKTLTPKSIPFCHSEKVSQVACNDDHLIVLLNDGTVHTITQGPVAVTPQVSQPQNADVSSKSDKSDNCIKKVFSRRKHSLVSLGVDLKQVDFLKKIIVTQIMCSAIYNFALSEKGQVFVWTHAGSNESLRGILPIYQNPLPEFQSKKVVQVACGFHHFIALCDDAMVFSWGQNQYGELGRLVKKGEIADCFHYPRVIDALVGIPVVFVTCGGYHSVALTKLGTLFTWGCNAVGQLGLGDEIDRSAPSLQLTLKGHRITYISCGEFHTAFLSLEGQVYTCGAGADGQLGHSNTEDSSSPLLVSSLASSIITQIACGRRHTVVYIASSKMVYTFGQRWFNQLGFCHASSHDFFTPSTVQGPWSSMEEIPSTHSFNPLMSVVSMSTVTSLSMKCLYAGSYYSIAQVTSKKSAVDFRNVSCGIVKSIQTLNLDKAREIARVPPNKPISCDMRHYIQSAFSVSNLNSFFLTVENKQSKVECTRNDPQIKVSKIREVFGELSRAKNSLIPELLLCAVENLIFTLGSDPVDIEGLVIYLALPECHFFQQPLNYATVSLPFAKAFCRLPKSSRTVLIGWWSCNNAEYFQTISGIYKQSLLYVLQLSPASSRLENTLRSQTVQMSIRILSHLSWLNKKRNLGLDDTIFQVPALEDYVDLVQDYANWISDKRQKTIKHKFHFCSYPYVFGTGAKATLLHADAEMHQRRAMKEAVEWNVLNLFVPVGKRNPYLTIKVSRSNIVGDTFKQLADCNRKDMKKPFRVIFDGEETLDSGGMNKEFFMLFMKEALNPKYGLFIEAEGGTLWFNQFSFDGDSMFALVGIVCGLAAYNNNLIAAKFPSALYKMLIKEKTTLSDLNDLYPSIMHGLRTLLRYKYADLEQMFQLTFQASQEFYGKCVDTELKPGGAKIMVTQENKREYVHLYLEHLVYRSVKEKIVAFSTGFRKVCSSCVLNVFRSDELRALLTGNDEYNWLIMQLNTQYRGEYCSTHPTIRAFWKVFHKMEMIQKKKFLKFVTGSDRIPIIGMKQVKLIVRPMAGSEDFLPESHVCLNMLDLPIYSSQKKLKHKLLQSIGFNESAK
uniref:HECT domain-containing protein n=1 Tax=Strigamia maritima TaxID=126957 RepID=T1JEH4_STRMM